MGRGEGVLRRHTWKCCVRYRWWDSVRWRDRLWLRWWYRRRVAWLVSSRGVVSRLRRHPIHHWRLCKAWKGRETDPVRLFQGLQSYIVCWTENVTPVTIHCNAKSSHTLNQRHPAILYLVVTASLCSFD